VKGNSIGAGSPPLWRTKSKGEIKSRQNLHHHSKEGALILNVENSANGGRKADLIHKKRKKKESNHVVRLGTERKGGGTFLLQLDSTEEKKKGIRRRRDVMGEKEVASSANYCKRGRVTKISTSWSLP